MSEKEKIDDGGSAFPRAGYDGVDSSQIGVDGMSLRSWFAGMALQGQIAYEGLEGCDKDQIVGMVFEIADALILKSKEG